MKMKNILIFGSGGHASVVIDIAQQEKKYEIIGIIDEPKNHNEISGLPILSNISTIKKIILEKDVFGGIIAIGDNAMRMKVRDQILSEVPNFQFVNCIHPNAVVASNVLIGEGNAVMAGSIVNPNCQIFDHCIINTNSSLDHDCKMLNFSSIAPNGTVGGNCIIGEYSAIGIGANILHNIFIGSNCIVGGGSLVCSNTEDSSIYYGTPAKLVKSREFGDKYL
jgi:sugar O-acyltransferase (sialic acid O-acetyltransferase NeuD family)